MATATIMVQSGQDMHHLHEETAVTDVLVYLAPCARSPSVKQSPGLDPRPKVE